MRINITHGVHRVLMLAQSYRPVLQETLPPGASIITSLGMLLALEEESECRASLWLAEYKIDHETIAAVLPFERHTTYSIVASENDGNGTILQNVGAKNRETSPFYTRKEIAGMTIEPRLRFFVDGDVISTGRIEPSLAEAIFSMMQRLHPLVPHPIVATEHLLLALALEEGTVGNFLRNNKVSPTELLERVAELEGVDLDSEVAVITDWDIPEPRLLRSTDHPCEKEPLNEQTCSHETCPQCETGQSNALNQSDQPSQANQVDQTSQTNQVADQTNQTNQTNHVNQMHGSYEPRLSHEPESHAVFRIIDASANRAFEATRVIEDYLRFGLDDQHLTGQTKQIRHELASALRELPDGETISARNTLFDVGTVLEGKNEYCRATLDDLLKANFSRLQESLRSIEEYGKIVSPALARKTEQLRYHSYTLQKALHATLVGVTRLAEASLYVLVDARPTPEAFATLVQAIIQGGVGVIQLRAKNIDDRTLLERARLLRRLISGTRTLMVVNDRPDIAVLSHADGVHVGQEELPIAEVRRLVGAKMIIGVSTHNIEQARKAVLEGANYLGAGPTFPSPTKSFESFPGTAFLEQLAAEIRIPVFAIGGINTDNLPPVLKSGIRRVAVQSVVVDAPAPSEMCRQLRERLTFRQ